MLFLVAAWAVWRIVGPQLKRSRPLPVVEHEPPFEYAGLTNTQE
jgi:hypothetical protein